MKIVRYARSGDEDQIEALYKLHELEVPELTENTLVSVKDGEILAVFSARVVTHCEWVCKDSVAGGYRAGLEVFKAGENMIRANGVHKYMVGILRGATDMREIAEKVGFETWGQLIYEKSVGDLIL